MSLVGSKITPINTPEHLKKLTDDCIISILQDYPGGLERVKETINNTTNLEIKNLACNHSNELSQFYTEYLQEARRRDLTWIKK